MAIYTFPKVGDIIQDRTVIRQMDAAWNRMISSATASARYEYGFYIYYNRKSNSYYTGNIEQGFPTSGCMGTNACIALGKASNNQECCAFFHCHTTLHFCPDTNRRPTGPSQPDENFAKNVRLPGILYDYSRFEIKGGHPMNDPHKIYTFGRRNRPDMPY